ncbi:MAG: glycerophosphodiester phosphodiesterase [Hyphomicrobiaceae bacterium]|nr:MAG: glycerophosphodiester phosphodiesterase [Hyphomicrobiaceae bacterium]
MLDRRTFLRPIAHRGLHNAAKGMIENTGPAFLAAIEKGYGIECDLQSAADGTPMVFHDETLDRLVDGAGAVAARLPADLAALRYRGQDTRILRFADFLALVCGRVPLLVEVKSNDAPAPAGFLENIAGAASAYAGPIALMSFDPALVSALGALAPAVPCGLVVGSNQLPPAAWYSMEEGVAAATDLLGAAPEALAFLAVDVRLLPLAHAWRARSGLDLPLFVWTVRTPKDRAVAARFADAPIFEGFEA